MWERQLDAEFIEAVLDAPEQLALHGELLIRLGLERELERDCGLPQGLDKGWQRVFDDHGAEVFVRTKLSRKFGEHTHHVIDVFFVGHANLDDRSRPAVSFIADARDGPVGNEMHNTAAVSQYSANKRSSAGCDF